MRSIPAPMKRSRLPGHSTSVWAEVVSTMWCRCTLSTGTGVPLEFTTSNRAPFSPKLPVGRGKPDAGDPMTSPPAAIVKGP